MENIKGLEKLANKWRSAIAHAQIIGGDPRKGLEALARIESKIKALRK